MSGRSQGDVLAAALTRHLGPMHDLRHDWTEWHSATFSGARHRMTFMLDDDAATGQRLQCIGEAELPIAGGFIADIALVSVAPVPGGVTVALEALTIAE